VAPHVSSCEWQACSGGDVPEQGECRAKKGA
jgi:hypothetical protein